MVDRCVVCGADVSDLGGHVCLKCLMQSEAEEAVKKTIKSAKDKRKARKRMLKKISEWFKWPSVEKRKYETVLKSFRKENDDLRIKFYDATMENSTLKDHIERLLEFTELTPEQEKEWCNGKSQSMYWIPVTERLPEKGKYDWVLVKTKFNPEGFSGVPHVAELRHGDWYCDCCEGPMEAILGLKVVAWFDMEQIKYPKFKKEH